MNYGKPSEILICGEDNPAQDAPEHALFPHPPGCAGERLQENIFGITRRTYLGLWRINLCADKWSVKTARTTANALLKKDLPWSTVILLGRKVADAADYPNPTFTVSLKYDGLLQIVSIPHPSGRNRAWNDPANIARVRAMLMNVAPEIPWGENND
jgi:hypothetical protein